MATTSNPYAERITFEKTKAEVEFPDLLGVQIDAFQSFIQEHAPEDERLNIGLEEVFKSVFPIEDSHKNYVLEYKSYFLGLAKYTAEECMDRGLTYSVPLKVRLVLHITNEDDRSKYDQSIEQEVYFGNIPYMTNKGTFVINGAERVIVSQLQRSPGVFFDQSIHPNGTKLFQARIIPFRGSWVDFTLEVSNLGNTQDAITMGEATVRSCPHLSVSGMEQLDNTVVQVTSTNGDNKATFTLRLEASSSHQERTCEVSIAVESEGDGNQRSSTFNVDVSAPAADDLTLPEDDVDDDDTGPLSTSDSLPWPPLGQLFLVCTFAVFFAGRNRTPKPMEK